MPELPEVEVNARHLSAWTVGRRIARVTPPPGTRETGGVPPAELARRLRGRKVLAVTRRGKWMLVRLEGGAGLALHLGMTGKIARVAAGAAPPRFTRAVFDLDRGGRVCFVDSRRFGRVYADEDYQALAARREIAEIGPDALEELGAAQLGAALAGTSRTVKEAIMDQRVAAGVGNLYATEALWRARIHPAAKAREIAADPARVKALLAAIRAALRHGLRAYDPRELPRYIEEGAPNPFHAYDRAGQPCHRCRTLLEAVTVGGRTSAYCPRCQGTRRIPKGNRGPRQR